VDAAASEKREREDGDNVARLEAFREFLRKGGKLIKHGRQGKPHGTFKQPAHSDDSGPASDTDRRFRVTERMVRLGGADRLMWKPRSYVLLRDIVEIRRDCSGPVFKRAMSREYVLIGCRLAVLPGNNCLYRGLSCC